MALQTKNLGMVALGIKGDDPPKPPEQAAQVQPPLKDGIHLRWSFCGERGFPWHGYYLFRRPHFEPDPEGMGVPGRETEWESIFPFKENLVRHVEITIKFLKPARVEILASLWGRVVLTKTESGIQDQELTTTLAYDAISEIQLKASPKVAKIIALRMAHVATRATQGWEAVPGFAYPLCLPIRHPDYPCTAGLQEDDRVTRELASSRILYGDPAKFLATSSSVLP